MKLIRTVKGLPRGRFEITPLQREILGRMIDAELYSYNDLAKRLAVSPVTLSRHLRGSRKNPVVLKKLLRFLGKDATVKSLDSRLRGNDGRRSAA
jgi:DNA-binding CsgD family transcriptional regulator